MGRHRFCLDHHVSVSTLQYLKNSKRSNSTASKNDINQKFAWFHLISVIIEAFARASSSEVEIYRDMIIWKVRIYFLLYHFWIKTRSSAPFLTTHTPNNLYCITKHENDVQSPVKTYPIIALHEHEAIFHVLGLYSTDQIPFFRIRDRSITCAFLTNNLHSIPYSNSITRTKLTFSYLGINPIVC